MKRGFTLIELLVVIAIIGIISAIVLTSLGTARAKARDTGRKASVHQVQNALQLYYTENGAYPVSASPDVIENLSGALTPKFIKSITIDENNTSGTAYYSSNGSSYLIYIATEQQTQASPSAYGCRIGIGADVTGRLYSTAPIC